MIEACKIVYNDGVAGVFNNDGSPSSLYNEALEYFGNQEEALEVWQASYTQEYNEIIGKSPETSNLKDVLSFLSDYSISNSIMSEREISDVLQFMVYNNIPSLYDLTNKLESTFKNEGNFEISTRRLVKSGLYTQDEANSLSPDYLLTTLNKLASLSSFTDITVINSGQNRGGVKKTTGEKTIFETYKTQSLVDVAEYALRNSPTKSEYEVLTTLSNSDEFNSVVSELENSVSLRSNIMNSVNEYRAVGRVFVDIDGSLTANNISEQTTVKNTILSSIDPLELQADIEFLDGISLEVWKDKSEAIQRVIRKIEKNLIKYNVDIIGLSEVAMFDREGTLVLLESTSDMLMSPTVENIVRFAEVKNELIISQNNQALITDNPALSGLNIVHFETDLSPSEVFDNYGLLKVGDNTYHATDISKEDAYLELYERFQTGELIIPTELITTEDPFDIENYQSTLESISNYINSRDTGIINSNDNEAISLSQVLFGYGKFTSEHRPTSDPIENEDYLKTEFVSDFYQYKLEEKFKGSDIYDKVLKYFTISDSDINFNSIFVPDIRGMKYENELRNYANLKKEGQIKLFSNTANTGTDIDIEVINNPEIVNEISGMNFAVNENYIITSNSNDLYTRIGGEVYRKVYSNLNGDNIYQAINTNNDNVYYDSNINFSTDLENAKRVLDETVIKNPEVSAETVKDKTNISDKVRERINFSELSTLELTQTLGVESPNIQEMIQSGEISYRNELGELCAELGLSTKFKKGYKWQLSKEIEGDSHERGGVDITITDSRVEIRNNDSVIKAERGMIIPRIITTFTKGNSWELVKEIEGNSHKNGGVDLTLTEKGVIIKNNNSEVKAKYGLVLPNKKY